MPQEPNWISDHHVVEFSIELDGRRQIIWISEEALEDRFGAWNRDDCVPVLLRNLPHISEVAERAARQTPEGNRVLLTTRNF